MVGALLAAGPTLSAHFGLDLFRENVRSFVRDAGGYHRFRAVMASVGLRSTSRLDKDFRDLRLAIAAKNATIKRRRLEATKAALITAIEAARATPCNQPPVPTVTEVA